MALRAGFGLDFQTCDPDVFAAVIEELAEKDREIAVTDAMARLRRRLGR